MKAEEYGFQTPEINLQDVYDELQKIENASLFEQMQATVNIFGVSNESVCAAYFKIHTFNKYF